MDQAAVDCLKEAIGTLGFPIFVAIWLLIRTDRLLIGLRKTITELHVYLKQQNGGE
jgi:hypothetical protein